MATTRLTRRALLRSTAAAAALAGAPFVRGAYAAGKLGVATWDHWMPGANDVLQKLAQEWAEKGESRAHDRFRHQPGRQTDADGCRRSGGPFRTRGHPSTGLVRCGQGGMWEPADDLMTTLIGKSSVAGFGIVPITGI